MTYRLTNINPHSAALFSSWLTMLASFIFVIPWLLVTTLFSADAGFNTVLSMFFSFSALAFPFISAVGAYVAVRIILLIVNAVLRKIDGITFTLEEVAKTKNK